MNVDVAKSYLYVPGDSGRRLELAHTRGADAVIADLEDAVTEDRKEEARTQVATWLESPDTASIEQWVRVRPGADGVSDVQDVLRPQLYGVCIAKANPESVLRIADTLDRIERHAVGPHGAVRLMPLIETAEGLLAAGQIARSPRVLRLQLGEIDLSAELGLQPGDDELELLPYRSLIVAEAARAGLQPAVGAVWPAIRDIAGLERSTRRLQRMGYHGRVAIHPVQLPTIHAVFAPSAQELAQARQVLATYTAAQASGVGAAVDDQGRMVDEAVVRRSRSLLASEEAQRKEMRECH